MIEDEEDYWQAPDGTKYRVGEVIPVLRLENMTIRNEMIIKGSCDLCGWAIIAPSVFANSFIAVHAEVCLQNKIADEFRHPDYTE